ncbi:MAG: PEP-CTERM sorting domain-containing protein [Akkermansiaceae bacterium]|nr:PEP-CTERM sorting domain-containing protein [Akkermansiaceae bacterium]
MKMNKQMKTILPLAVIAGLAVTANAAVVITPAGATTTGGNLSGRPIGNTIDSSGLSGGGISGNILTETHSVNTNSDLWLSANGNGSGVEFVFDLGGTYTVDSVHLWNYDASSGANNRGLQTVDVTFSTDGGFNYNTLVAASGYDDFGNFAQAPLGATQASAETKTFTAVAGVTHIKFTDSTNHGATYTGIGEIRFGGDPIPEPSTTALLGLGGLALILRRRK